MQSPTYIVRALGAGSGEVIRAAVAAPDTRVLRAFREFVELGAAAVPTLESMARDERAPAEYRKRAAEAAKTIRTKED